MTHSKPSIIDYGKDKHCFQGEADSEKYKCLKCGLVINKLMMVNGIDKKLEWSGSRFPKDWNCEA